ncbi:MAG TPA: hypothetical protein VJ890_01945 [Vineibacter sp.]|nr:hypothetical protein [Vineibacter sp.]
MSRQHLYILAFSITMVLSAPSLAQDIGWAAGTWKGRIEGFRGQDPTRTLSIAIDGGAAKCGWGEGFRSNPPAAKNCSVSATGVKLTSGANNQIDLRRSGNTLSGTMTTTAGDGKTYNLTMKKE